MRYDKLTIKGQEALVEAERLCGEQSNPQIEPEHLLKTLLIQEEGIIPPILSKLGVAQGTVFSEVEKALAKLPKVQGLAGRPISPNLNRVFEAAFREADRLKDEYVSTEHLLLGLTQTKSTEAQRILASHEVTPERILQVLVSIRGSQRVTDQNPEDKYQALQRYARDLTDLARRGKLDPVIGRDEEVRRVIQVLSRRTKNNPVLIGDPELGRRQLSRVLHKESLPVMCRKA